MPAILKDVRSELEIDHSGSTIIIGGAVPNLMVNTTARERSERSTIFLTAGPYATLDEARTAAETMADTHDIGTIYRVAPMS